MSHAPLPPSSAHVWVACAGSASLQMRYPEEGDQVAAAEGTAAHWVMEQLLHTGVAGPIAPNGVLITQEMREGSQLMVDYVQSVRGSGYCYVEKQIQIPRVHQQNYGTPDVVIWHDSPIEHLHIIDFKYGHGVVEVFENWQLIDYVAGYLSLIAARDARIVPKVTMTIVQPRAFHMDGPIRSWTTTADKLEDKIHALSMAAEEAMGDAPECKPKPQACTYCTARHACTALQQAAYRGMDISKQALSTEMNHAALGLELRLVVEALQLLEARKSGLQEQIEALMRRGQRVPHWTMVPGDAREKWRSDDLEVIAMGQMLGVNLAKPPEAITPVQAKKLGVDASIVAAYSFRPPAALKLKLDDGKDARRIFE